MAPAGDRLRIGVAGIGNMGSRHLAALLRRHDVQVSAVADPSMEAQSRAVDMAARAGRPVPRIYDDADAMLSGEELDAVVVATPPDLHVRHGLKALEASVPVLVEKPIATTVRGGHRLVCEFEDRSVLLTVGHVERFNPAVEAVQRQLRTLPIARPTLIETWRHGPPPPRPPKEGVALDLAIHDVDLVCLLLDELPVAACSNQTVDTSIQRRLDAQLGFKSGATARISVGWGGGPRTRRVVVHGEHGVLDADLLRQELRYRPSPDGVRSLEVYPADPLVREHDAFLGALRNGGPAPVSGRDGLAALSIVCALLASSADRELVQVEYAPGHSPRA